MKTDTENNGIQHSETAWVADYLDDEVERVVAHDCLYEIEHGITPVIVTTEAHHTPRRLSIIVAVAASIALVAIGAAALPERSTSTDTGSAVAPNETAAAAATETPVTETPVTEAPVTETTVPPTTMPVNQMPPGGIGFAGQTPLCTMVDAEVYNCTLPSSYDPAGDRLYGGIGAVDFYVDESSHVAGGCRSTSANLRNWVCFVGERAVAEGTVSPDGDGMLYLGQPALNQFSQG